MWAFLWPWRRPRRVSAPSASTCSLPRWGWSTPARTTSAMWCRRIWRSSSPPACSRPPTTSPAWPSATSSPSVCPRLWTPTSSLTPPIWRRRPGRSPLTSSLAPWWSWSPLPTPAPPRTSSAPSSRRAPASCAERTSVWGSRRSVWTRATASTRPRTPPRWWAPSARRPSSASPPSTRRC